MTPAHTCRSCDTPNEADARFCEGCGKSIARSCPSCGLEASETARFCRGCGTALDGEKSIAPAHSGEVARKTVTVLFADLAGSTSFEERVDAETAREVMGRYHELLRSTVARHHAGVTKYIGDGFMAVWGVPEIRADDAARAVEAAVDLQERFVDLAAEIGTVHDVELALRVSVNTGEVVVGAGDADLVGDALNVGARLESECPRGHVVVGEETWRATRGVFDYEALGEVSVKGRTAPVAVYRWGGHRHEAGEAAPFVGRADEIRRLQAVLDDAVAARSARLVTVVGDPGVGKSRTAAQFAAAQSDTRVVTARCDVERTVALAPFVEVIRGTDLESSLFTTVPERDRLLRDLAGLAEGVPGSVEETFWALRRFIEVLATGTPVLLVLDDIQWADTLLLDFIEHLVEWVRDVPVLILALARPELREARPDLVSASRWVSEAVHLGGLDAVSTAELAAKVLGANRLPDELLNRLPSSTGGNPLFVREFVGMLAHDRVLVLEPDGWRLTIDVDAITIPPTIHALLASRLERLDAIDRRVLEIASVVGNEFSLGTVCALTDHGAQAITLSLNRLRDLELAQPSGNYVGDEPVWRFHHVLIRDVAYRRLLKSDRAVLHERLAAWVETAGSTLAFDPDEMAARHLEAAHGYRRELGTQGAQIDALALRSARHYCTSARRALDRDELVSAGTQAARGAALAAADQDNHAELLLIGCEAFLSAGDVTAGAPLVDELDRIAGDALAPWASCYRCQYIVYTDPEQLLEVDTRLQGAIDEFARRKDPAGLAKAHRVRAGARARLGRIGDCEVDLFEALIAARLSGDHRQITAALSAAPAAALWGPSPVPKAGGRCLDVVRMQRMTTAAPSLEATSLRCLAVLELLRGRPDRARTMLADARQVVADLGLRHGLMETELFAGMIELMEGQFASAEPHFRTALKGMEALGVGADAGQAAALLARAVLAQGRLAEADEYAGESARLAGRNLKTAVAWRAVRAEILSAQERHDEAVAIAREAVGIAAETDLVLDHADACLALSRVLAAAGDDSSAKAVRAEAARLYAAKEVALTVDRGSDSSTSTQLTPLPSARSKDEDATFAYAEERAGATAGRLAVTNRSCATVAAFNAAMAAHNIEAVVDCYADAVVYDDHRRLSGAPVIGRDDVRAAVSRVLEQYSRFESRVLAVRGDFLNLLLTHWSDESGNESTSWYLNEVDIAGHIRYQGRFDEDDFEGAYRELESRYFSGEGAAFEEMGALGTEITFAFAQGDFDRIIADLTTPDFRVRTNAQSVFGDRSTTELRHTFAELREMVDSLRIWHSVMWWLSPTCSLGRNEREALGHDGEFYSWTRLYVFEFRDGRLASMCEFGADDEDAAFAYAEERVRANTGRLSVSNLATRTAEAFWRAIRSGDADAALECCSHDMVYDDRRRLSGGPVDGRDRIGLRVAFERILQQYDNFESRMLAIRGDRLHLAWSRWSNDAGYQTTYLHVSEVDGRGKIIFEGRFDADDFNAAYRELSRRYSAGEGAPNAAAAAVESEYMVAVNEHDFDRAFGELTAPQALFVNRSRSPFPDRSLTEFRSSIEDLSSMVTAERTWMSVTHWLTPTCCYGRKEREASGPDGEHFEWASAVVTEIRDGRVFALCQFDLEDEEAAFAYAQEHARATMSRLPLFNKACTTTQSMTEAMRVDAIDRVMALVSDRVVYEDRRGFSGNLIEDRGDIQAAFQRVIDQFETFEWAVLAVRGERLALTSSSWSDAYGNEATYLNVIEIDEDGRVCYEGRFDEDDFESAYRVLDQRYYAGEGAAYSEAGTTTTEWPLALNSGDFDRAFGELSTPDLRVINRSRSGLPDRLAAELRTNFEELNAIVASSRMWVPAIVWLSPSWAVFRLEREAVGLNGEHFEWTRLHACEFRDSQLATVCQFELDDEDAAFAYAEEQVRRPTSRLSVANRASETFAASGRAAQVGDVDAMADCYAEDFHFDDRRSLGGNALESVRTAAALIIEQYNHFEGRTLAVRGERLQLGWSRWSNDEGYETTYLFVHEVNDGGRFTYEGRFDENDFENAYRELDHRYHARDGEESAEAGWAQTEWIMALNNREYDRLFGELTDPDMRFEMRSSSPFPDRSVPQLRASLEEWTSRTISMRAWHSATCWVSPTCCVSRNERIAVGRDGEHYAWTRIYVFEFLQGRCTAMCEFDLDDEAAAFAYAQERVRAAQPG